MPWVLSATRTGLPSRHCISAGISICERPPRSVRPPISCRMEQFIQTSISTALRFRRLPSRRLPTPLCGDQLYEGPIPGICRRPVQRAAFGTVLLTLAHDSGPDLYHCAAGKDRTGWTSAILESIAGVSSATIMKDYLATKAIGCAHDSMKAAILAQNPGCGPGDY